MAAGTIGFSAELGCRGFLSNSGVEMAAVLTLGAPQKAAGDKIRIYCDFGNEPLLQQGFAIASQTVTAAGLTVASVQLDFDYQVSALISGGSSGTDYDITYAVTLDDPDGTILSRTGVLQVL